MTTLLPPLHTEDGVIAVATGGALTVSVTGSLDEQPMGSGLVTASV
jgi:hypothetical protein